MDEAELASVIIESLRSYIQEEVDRFESGVEPGRML